MADIAGITATALRSSVPSLELHPIAPTGAPDGLASARFSTLMQAPAPEQVSSAQSVSAAPQADLIDPPATTLGDRMLQGMERVSGELKARWDTVSDVLKSGNAISTHDMLKVQMELTRITVEYELVGKLTNRSTQTIEQLERLQ